MRSCVGLLPLAFFASVLSACGAGEAPPLIAAAQAQVDGQVLHDKIHAFTNLTQVWDEHAALTVVDDPTRSSDLRELVSWMRSRVGACVRYEMKSIRGDAQARFELMCQRGGAEVAFYLDKERRYQGLELGLRGVEADPAVRRAARQFVTGVDGESCRLGRDLLVGRRAARTLIVCEGEDDRVLTLRLDEQGGVERAHLAPARFNG